jgi:hypothetical protein
MRQLVYLRVVAVFELLHPDTGTTLRSDRFDKRVHQRPRYLDDDARGVAREKMLEEVVRRGRILTSRGGVKRLEKQIREAVSAR